MSELVKQTLIDFTTQYLSGMYIATYRNGRIIEGTGEQTLPLRRVLAASYLNSVFRSIIKRDDLYLNQTFDAIYSCEEFFNDSPVCLFHFLTIILETIDQSPDKQLYSRDLDQTRKAIYNYFLPEVSKCVSFYLLSKKDHICTGTKYSDITKEDPEQEIFKLYHDKLF